MTRMIAKAYRMADAVRATGVSVVMGGPHVTELADEALGRDGGPRHADAVALGEADETWPKIVEDAARGTLKDIYAPVDEFGKQCKPSLKPYPEIPWDKIKLDQFNLLPGFLHLLLKRCTIKAVPYPTRVALFRHCLGGAFMQYMPLLFQRGFHPDVG